MIKKSARGLLSLITESLKKNEQKLCNANSKCQGSELLKSCCHGTTCWSTTVTESRQLYLYSTFLFFKTQFLGHWTLAPHGITVRNGLGIIIFYADDTQLHTYICCHWLTMLIDQINGKHTKKKMVNILLAKRQNVYIVIVSMLACQCLNWIQSKSGTGLPIWV